MGHDLAHAAGARRRAFPLLVPFSRLGDLLVLEFVDRRVARLPLHDAEAPRIDHPRDLAVARVVLAVVPFVPLLINAVGHRHPADLQGRRPATVGPLKVRGKDPRPERPRYVLPDRRRRHATAPGAGAGAEVLKLWALQRIY